MKGRERRRNNYFFNRNNPFFFSGLVTLLVFEEIRSNLGGTSDESVAVFVVLRNEEAATTFTRFLTRLGKG